MYEDERLIDAESLAELLDCGVRTVRRMDAEGKLPAPVRVGRLVRWSLREIYRWIDAECPDRKTWDAMQRARR